ncbi:S-adenosyl-L-methionine-dependent methyltransferase [Microdochium bolleyi]|uniref:tRNA wybutosine-synthesizing protein 4 n=1 Tax=Microdochium bolleyi TaxID=196109 RepID=A0A136IXB9_9PEZI|nr:S-adenosyl-L-methionine-dependent methyltransferase [Microdochium bolleyi]
MAQPQTMPLGPGAAVPAKGRSVRAAGRPARALAQDDIVMATNSSSIVSKRSVEKIYYPHEPHYFCHFVKKFQRRSPLINRGYHIRLHVIDVAVRNFLRRPSSNTKVVVNLGCGSDVLPWQCLTRYPEDCRRARFVDIDFPELLRKKCEIVQNTPELREPLDNVVVSQNGRIFLTSDQYVQIGCDLRELDKIEESLATVLDLPNCEFLFVAEVSITYMETEGADGVIKWASSLGKAEFCLLEQILPGGPDHAFAKVMLQHFNKLKAPPKSVFEYPTLQAQRDRFARLGWAHTDANSLWQIWSGSEYFSEEDRKKLNGMEPFDEWEEFAIYAAHYCVVSARTWADSQVSTTPATGQLRTQESTIEFTTAYHPYTGNRGQRRFGAPLKVQGAAGESRIGNIFGLGTNTRLRSQDIYGGNFDIEEVEISAEGPASRMCHAAVDLGQHNLLCGGRTSPSSALKDSWILKRGDTTWSRASDLPVPLYRHAITGLGGESHGMALVVGGKTDSSTVFPGCLVYQPDCTWRECVLKGHAYTPVFGTVLLSLPETAASEPGRPQFSGVLLGGMLADGTVAQQSLHWTLEIPQAPEAAPTITFAPLAVPDLDPAQGLQPTIVNRFGAAGLVLNDTTIAIVGGVIADELLRPEEEILRITFSHPAGSLVPLGHILSPASKEGRRLAASHGGGSAIPRPLLVGVSATLDSAGDLVIMGGGGVCFSMGSYWNEGCYVVTLG